MEMRLLSREELQKLLIQAQAEGYYEVFLLELTTGLRVGLGIYPEDAPTCSKDTCSTMFIAALFMIARI